VTGFGRRKRPAVGLFGALAYLRSLDASLAEPINSPVRGSAPLSDVRPGIEDSLEIDVGGYLEAKRTLGVFPRVELAGGYVRTGYTDRQGDSATAQDWVARVRFAASLPIANIVLLDLGVSARIGTASQHESDLTPVPGVVDQTSSPSWAFAGSVDVGLRFLPWDPR
jgi:hypothetical protein